MTSSSRKHRDFLRLPSCALAFALLAWGCDEGADGDASDGNGGDGDGETPCWWELETTGDLELMPAYDYGILLYQAEDSNIFTFGDPDEGTPLEFSLSVVSPTLETGTYEADLEFSHDGLQWSVYNADLTLEREASGHIRGTFSGPATGAVVDPEMPDKMADLTLVFRAYDGDDAQADQACVDAGKYDIFGP